MCKHLPFSRTQWAPCKACADDKAKVVATKNKGKWEALIVEYTKEALEIEATGRKATWQRDEIKMYEKLLAVLN